MVTLCKMEKHASDIQWCRVYSTLQKGEMVAKQGSTAPKPDRNKEQTPNSCSSLSSTSGLTWTHPLLTATHSSIQGWFHSLYAALLDRHSRALTSPTQSRLHLHIFTQWSPYRDSPATPGFRLSLTGASIAPYSPILKTLKSELQGPCCQVWLPTRDTTYLLITFE